MNSTEKNYREGLSEIEKSFPGYTDLAVETYRTLSGIEFHKMEQDLAKEVIERDRLSLKQKIEISLLIASLMCAISFGINHQILACIFSSAATLYVFRQLINTAFFLGMSKGSINDYRQAIDLYKSLH